MAKYDLNNKVVVITGATGGLGQAVAKALIAKGAKLALLDLNQEQLNKQINDLGDSQLVAGWEANVCSLESMQNAMENVVQHFGKIDVVIAGAGIAEVVALEHIDPKLFEQTIDINLNGVFRTFRSALPYVKKTQGYLLAISSLAAFVHAPFNSHYAASKAGVWALCDSLRLELKQSNIGVGSFHPTFFRTPMMDAVQADPVGYSAWSGNKGIWKFVSLEEVVRDLVIGIEKRKDIIIVPNSNKFVASAPGLLRNVIEFLGFNQKQLKKTMQLSSKKTRQI